MADAPEMIVAANSVAVKTPIVEAYQRQLLARGQWLMASAFVDPGEERPVILDPKLSYLLEEEDAKTFQAQCAAQAAAAGLATRIPGNFPRTESYHQRYVLVNDWVGQPPPGRAASREGKPVKTQPPSMLPISSACHTASRTPAGRPCGSKECRAEDMCGDTG